MAATCRVPDNVIRAGIAYLDYLRVDCGIDLNSYLDERVLETLFVKMVAEHLSEFDPPLSEAALGCDQEPPQQAIHPKRCG